MNFKEVERKEEEFRLMFNDLKESILQSIEEIDLEGVAFLGDNYMTVKASAVMSNRNLSVDYYNMRKQADLVEEVLKRADTVAELKNNLYKMIKTKRVVLNGNLYTLNNAVLEALQGALQ